LNITGLPENVAVVLERDTEFKTGAGLVKLSVLPVAVR
jgi:hypothetical protein